MRESFLLSLERLLLLLACLRKLLLNRVELSRPHGRFLLAVGQLRHGGVDLAIQIKLNLRGVFRLPLGVIERLLSLVLSGDQKLEFIVIHGRALRSTAGRGSWDCRYREEKAAEMVSFQ